MLESLEQSLDKIGKAAALNLLGCIYLDLRNFEDAQTYFDESLKIRLKYLNKINPYHPDIGESFRNLGALNSKRLNSVEAERNYLRAAEIYRHNYPKSHSLVTEITNCLKATQKQRKAIQ